MTQDQHKLPEPTAFVWHQHLGERTKSLRWTKPNQWEYAEKVEPLYTEAQVRELLSAHLQQRPLPVREHLYDIVPPSAAEWLADSPGIANHDWRGGWDACRNRCRTLVDERLSAPSLPVRQEPTHLSPVPAEVPAGQVVAWMWQHEETGNVGFIDQWQIDNGWQAANPRLRLIRPLVFASSPSVQNMGEGETGKDGVRAVHGPSDGVVMAQALNALEHAQCGLRWYRDRYPEAADGSDDEADEMIDAAVADLKLALKRADGVDVHRVRGADEPLPPDVLVDALVDRAHEPSEVKPSTRGRAPARDVQGTLAGQRQEGGDV